MDLFIQGFATGCYKSLLRYWTIAILVLGLIPLAQSSNSTLVADRFTSMATVGAEGYWVKDMLAAILSSDFILNQMYYVLLIVPAAIIICYTKRKYGHDPESAPVLLRVFALDHRPLSWGRGDLRMRASRRTYQDGRGHLGHLDEETRDLLKGQDDKPESNGHVIVSISPSAKANGHVTIETNKGDGSPAGSSSKIAQLVGCFLGLQAVFLTWGLVQEKIVTKPYASSSTSPTTYDRFTDSQFLVFSNKLSGFILAAIYLTSRAILSPTRAHRAEEEESAGGSTLSPALYRYAFASLSNVVSSWCQYEALRFVTFPTQVLFKSGKIIPAMLMNRLISTCSGTVPKKKYNGLDYASAALVSVGISAFLLSKRWESPSGAREKLWPMGSNSMLGITLLTLYVIFDSFTSNWQGQIFQKFNGPKTGGGGGLGRKGLKVVTSWDMMCYVNLYSSLFTGSSLIFKSSEGGLNSLSSTLTFALQHPAFIFDMTALSLCSALGQVFIFLTISTFGPVAFVTMMTIRQGFAVLLSCLIYGHRIGTLGYAGVLLVFVALFGKIYLASGPSFQTLLRSASRLFKQTRLSLTTRNKMAKRYCLF